MNAYEITELVATILMFLILIDAALGILKGWNEVRVLRILVAILVTLIAVISQDRLYNIGFSKPTAIQYDQGIPKAYKNYFFVEYPAEHPYTGESITHRKYISESEYDSLRSNLKVVNGE